VYRFCSLGVFERVQKDFEINSETGCGKLEDMSLYRQLPCRMLGMTHPHPGRSSKLYPATADFEKTRDEKLSAVDHAAISAAGYAVDGKGWLVPAKKRLPVEAIDERLMN
jgi:hypothetical protein